MHNSSYKLDAQTFQCKKILKCENIAKENVQTSECKACKTSKCKKCANLDAICANVSMPKAQVSQCKVCTVLNQSVQICQLWTALIKLKMFKTFQCKARSFTMCANSSVQNEKRLKVCKPLKAKVWKKILTVNCHMQSTWNCKRVNKETCQPITFSHCSTCPRICRGKATSYSLQYLCNMWNYLCAQHGSISTRLS